MTARRARVIRIFADVRTRDDAADAMLTLHDFARDAAVFVELVNRHIILVCGNLQHAVCRRVDDEGTRFLLLTAVIVNDLRAGIRLVADNLAAECLLELCNDFRREAVRIRRHRALRDNAGDFPMARRRILAAREFAQAGKGTNRILHGGPAADAIDVEKADLLHVRRIVFRRSGNRLQRIADIIAKIRSIRLAADAEAVEHNDKRTFERLHFISSFLYP